MDDKHLVIDVFNEFHFVVRFSLKALKQMKFLISLNVFFKYFIFYDEQLCTIGKCSKNTFDFFNHFRLSVYCPEKKEPFSNEISKLTKNYNIPHESPKKRLYCCNDIGESLSFLLYCKRKETILYT